MIGRAGREVPRGHRSLLSHATVFLRARRGRPRCGPGDAGLRKPVLGKDTGTPVVEDYADKMPFSFTGKLDKLVIELGKSGLTAGDGQALKDAATKLTAARE